MQNTDSSLRENFRRLFAENRLGQAYLFYGEDKSGINQEVLSILNELEGRGENFQGAPSVFIDALIFDADSVNSLGIEIVRMAKNFLWHKPVKSQRRAVVIFGAEVLTQEAQNAVLKILEDTPPSGLLVLTATTTERFLLTINSRLQKVFVPARMSLQKSQEDPRSEEVQALARRFLYGNARERYSLAKEITDLEKAGDTNLTVAFLDELINILKQKPDRNTEFLGELLHRRRLIGDYSLNKRLQLAFLSTLWYN